MSTRFAAGAIIGRYRIVSRIGAGGMGEVFKAQDTSLERPVALKILPPDLVKNQDRVRRFVQEAKAASGLSHPHIVTIHEVGEIPADGQQTTRYIAMEFVHGVTLRTKIYDQRTPLKEMLEYLAQAADALAKAHAAGIVHRDLKPDNIMVTQDGYAKVLDFGLAKLTEKHFDGGSDAKTAMREQTREGVVVGTLGYMSPEQVRGAAVDHRSDIFSLGCILYEAATKQKPFVADSDIDVLHKIVHDEPASVSEIAPSVPAELRRLIRRCLAKDPDRRYQSMKDIAIELRDLSQEFESLGSGSMSAPAQALRTRPWQWWVAVALAVVGVGAVITALLLRRGPAASSPKANFVFVPLTSHAGIETHPRLSPDGNYVVYAGNARGNPDIYLQRLAGLNAINLTASSTAADSQPAISPDGQFIAFRSEREGGGIFLMGATGESVRRLTEHGFHPAWSPDGKEIAYSTASWVDAMNRGARGELWAVNVQTGANRRIAGQDAVQAAWSPNGKWIAYWGVKTEGGIRDISVVSASGGTPIAITNDVAADWNPLWSPDGTSLYFISNRSGTMNLWRIAVDPESGRPAGSLDSLMIPAQSIGFIDASRDGKKFVFASLDTRSAIERLDFDPRTETVTAAPVPVLRGSLRAGQPQVSPDGQWVAFRSEGEREDLYLVKSDGSELRKLTDDIHRDRAPRWWRDGRELIFYSDRSGRYDIWSVRSDGSGLRQITSTNGPSLWFPVPSPDEKWLTVHNGQGSYLVSLLKSPPVSQIDNLPPFEPGRVFRAAAWSPDGRWIAGTDTTSESTSSRGVVIFSVAERTYQRITDGGTGPDWLPDSRRLAYRHQDELKIVDRVSRRTTAIGSTEGTSGTIVLDVSADGRAIYYIRSAAESDIWLMTLQ